MVRANNKSHQSDFNEEELVKTDQHKADIDKINERILKLESRFGTNECIADTIFSVTERDTKMQKMISDVLTKLISSDNKVRKMIGDYINESDRNVVTEFLRRFGLWVFGLIMLALGSFITTLVQMTIKAPKP